MEEELKDAVIVGDDAEEFVAGRLGQKVIELARIEVDAAALEMCDVDLEDKKKLREIQFKIWCATKFESWLQEIITRGREALQPKDVE